MSVDRPPSDRTINWPRTCGRGLAGVWALFWCLFGITTAASEGKELPVIMLHGALPGALFAILAILACCRERGGNILVVTATLTGAAYAGLMSSAPWLSLAAALLLLSAPPLVAGLLLEASELRPSRSVRVLPSSDSSSRLQSVIR